MRVTCVVFFAASLSLSPMLPPGLDWEDGYVSAQQEGVNRYGLDPFYALNVWAWRDNPHGTFVELNPNVACDGFVPTT